MYRYIDRYSSARCGGQYKYQEGFVVNSTVANNTNGVAIIDNENTMEIVLTLRLHTIPLMLHFLWSKNG